jgi:hypothetical protein
VRIGDAMSCLHAGRTEHCDDRKHSCLHAGRTEHCDDRKHRVLSLLPLKPPTSRIQSNKQKMIIYHLGGQGVEEDEVQSPRPCDLTPAGEMRTR